MGADGRRDDSSRDETNGAKQDANRDTVIRSDGHAVMQKMDGGATRHELPELDEFGLPLRPARRRQHEEEDEDEFQSADEGIAGDNGPVHKAQSPGGLDGNKRSPRPEHDANVQTSPEIEARNAETNDVVSRDAQGDSGGTVPASSEAAPEPLRPKTPENEEPFQMKDKADEPKESVELKRRSTVGSMSPSSPKARRSSQGVSEWSHQQLAPALRNEEIAEEDDSGWQEMPALATFRQYDDWGKITAQSYDEVEDDEAYGYGGLGGAGRGYTRVQIDEDAQSATSMDDNTAYLFKGDGMKNNTLDDDEEARDLVTQMQTTKELLTDGQRIAYVGIVRLNLATMLDGLAATEKTRNSRKTVELCTENMKMWAQKMMVRLYSHMEINSNEQIMVEQLAEHGVLPSDMSPTLIQNAVVKNPQRIEEIEPVSGTLSEKRNSQNQRLKEKLDRTTAKQRASDTVSPPLPSTTIPEGGTDNAPASSNGLHTPPPKRSFATDAQDTPKSESSPPSYEEALAENMTLKDPLDLEEAKTIELDIRWTVLCDLFLLLIADSTYDARSRTLLEHVGETLRISWQEICRFEKRVTDALEMQEEAEQENWNEEEHLAFRRRQAWKKRAMLMGLCTVGGGLVIGLSAGLLAPVIGAGLAAGFTTFGVTGTATFLGSTGAAALIGTTGATIGGTIGVRAAARRSGAVKTFEYRPLHNNKRVNLIVTVSGWMAGRVDDVRLPFSTVDPIMGDIYSVFWEPEMLQSTGQTIRILGTEALTQTIQQILGTTILTALMAGLSLPIVLAKLSYLIDNPWSVSMARADAAGLILADSLIDRNLGNRPITLVGYSLGSRVIFSCLRELAARGGVGIIQNVYLFGTPVVQNKENYIRARAVVSGRFVNGYASNDWILGYLFRATAGGIMRVAGLSAIDIPGIENMDCTELVPGHMSYRNKMPVLLRTCGWVVDSDEFTEIEDPDPENHEKRQRELISEIEAARRDLEEKENAGKKKGFASFFSRRKAKTTKKDWETYDPSKVAATGEIVDPDKLAQDNMEVMFDVDAIRKEALQLAVQGGDIEEIKQHLQVREIQSTMPMMRVSSTPVAPTFSRTESEPYSSPRQRVDDASEASLSFDTEDRPQMRSPPHANGYASSGPPTPSPGPGATPPVSTTKSSLSLASEAEHTRPPLKSAATAPSLGENTGDSQTKAWADHNYDDDEFGQEKEVSMTFD